MKFQNQVLSLHSDALPADTLLIQKLEGDERMSGLFRFELDLICEDENLDLEAVLYAPAKLGIKIAVGLSGGQVGMATREIAGVFAEFEELEQGQGWTKYRAVLVPKLWHATRTFRSRIFMEKNIEDLATEVLEADELSPALDFEFELNGSYDPREYVVQYEETDWDFLARWLEHEGIYFYFVNDSGEEKVKFADSESSFMQNGFGTTYPYKPEAAGEGGESDNTEEEIRAFSCRQSRLPKKVSVNDYNWRVPSVQLHHTEDVHEDGTGHHTHYNDHFKDQSQGTAIATLRKEELVCRSKVFYGNGSCRAFRPGTTFELEGHFRDDFNRSYVLTAVHHKAEQMISLESATVTGVSYENSFEAVTDDQPWRPARVTAWPSIHGVMHAKIDAEGNGQYAELDEHGRYKIKLPFDEGTSLGLLDDGKASRWVRMAQPYAGENAGMHFPLLKGTEVIVSHIDGDPDRPIIVGAVPNPETESPATGENNTQNGIRTAGGTRMDFDDSADAPGFLFRDATASYVVDMRRHRGSDGGVSTGRSHVKKKEQKSGSGGVEPATPATGRPEQAPAAATGNAGEPAQGTGDTQATGSGMVAPNNALTAPGVQGAWDTFTAAWSQDPNNNEWNTALADIAKNGRYRKSPRSTLSLSTFDKNGEAGVNPPSGAAGTDKINGDGLEKMLKYVTGVASNVGDNRGRSFSSNPLDDVYNFEGNAWGSRVRAWIGDNITLRVGDEYTYADVSRVVSIGTGGYSISEEHGDTDDKTYHFGNATTYSKHTGNTDSESHVEGDSDSYSFVHGQDTSVSLTFGAGATFSLHVSARTDNSVTLGAFNSNSLKVGVFGGLEISVAPKIEIEIGLQVGALDLTAWQWQVGLNQSSMVMNKSDVKLAQQEVDLNKTMARLLGTKAAVSETDNKLLEMQNKLSATENALNSNNAVLAKAMTHLNCNMANLQMNETNLQTFDLGLLRSNTAALHSIT